MRSPLLPLLLAFMLLVACGRDPPNLQATSAVELMRERTVVAKAVRSIQATSTSERKINQCLRYPLQCQSLGLNWQRLAEACRAEVRAGLRQSQECWSALLLQTPTPLPAYQPPSWAPPRPGVPRPSKP